MCELLGMSANVPTDICFSFSGLIERGGHTGPHSDGWGIAFYEGRGCRTFHDVDASANSEIAKFLKRYSIKSDIVVSHIRRATHGKVCLENTHPFQRELWGRPITFAHNGKVPKIKKEPLHYYNPVGTTDSEWAFCWMMDALRGAYTEPPRGRKALTQTVKDLADHLHELGIFNMLLSDGKHLFAYCGTQLSWVTRRAPFGEARLIDTEMAVNFQELTRPDDVVSVVATRPLTDNEDWTVMEPGSLVVFRDGHPVEQIG